jgi:hypothetical protein
MDSFITGTLQFGVLSPVYLGLSSVAAFLSHLMYGTRFRKVWFYGSVGIAGASWVFVVTDVLLSRSSRGDANVKTILGYITTYWCFVLAMVVPNIVYEALTRSGRFSDRGLSRLGKAIIIALVLEFTLFVTHWVAIFK